MKLLELRSNQPTFKTVSFNKRGLSIIVGKKRSEDKKKTYNSVGKSLIIALIHFCLASNKNKAFEKKLIAWEFELDFLINEVEYTAKRNTQNQNKIFWNEQELSLDSFRKKLGVLLFGLTEPIKFLTFRSLLSRFIRPYKSSYVSYENFVNKEPDYNQLLNNAYLLGLDIIRIQKKYELKEKLDEAKKLKKNIENDQVMKTFFEDTGKADDLNIKVVSLEKKVTSLEKNIAQFKIAEDYQAIREEANDISVELRDYKLKAITIQNAISNIKKSLQVRPDITRSKILNLYKKAEVQLGKLVVKQLEEVEAFNKKILINRGLQLGQEKQKFEQQLEEVQEQIKRLSRLEDQKLQYLNTHGALDDYTQLNKRLSDYRMRLEKLQQYKKITNEYKNNLERVKGHLSKENIETNNYLEQAFPIIAQNIQLFQSFVEEFYVNKNLGITVTNNEGENKLRYNIQAKIQDDRGDGVNEVKIFCFDWTLLKGQHHHNMAFLFHDGRILSEIDPRQVATMFKVAFKEAKENNWQYIISANQNVLDSIQNEMTPEEYKQIIKSSEILELNDQSVEGKLLGIQVDLDYERQ